MNRLTTNTSLLALAVTMTLSAGCANNDEMPNGRLGTPTRHLLLSER